MGLFMLSIDPVAVLNHELVLPNSKDVTISVGLMDSALFFMGKNYYGVNKLDAESVINPDISQQQLMARAISSIVEGLKGKGEGAFDVVLLTGIGENKLDAGGLKLLRSKGVKEVKSFIFNYSSVFEGDRVLNATSVKLVSYKAESKKFSMHYNGQTCPASETLSYDEEIAGKAVELLEGKIYDLSGEEIKDVEKISVSDMDSFVIKEDVNPKELQASYVKYREVGGRINLGIWSEDLADFFLSSENFDTHMNSLAEDSLRLSIGGDVTTRVSEPVVDEEAIEEQCYLS